MEEMVFDGDSICFYKGHENGFVRLLLVGRGIDIYFSQKDWEEFKSEMNHVIMTEQFSPN